MTVSRVMVLIAAMLVCAGCPAWYTRTAETPMPAVYHVAHGPERAQGLIVFMPGLRDGPGHFVDNGFVARVAELNQPWDVVAVDSHYGYFRREPTLVERLHQDVIAPARAKGYRQIWLVGISLGGFGALTYARAHPDHLTGLVVIAPYMGDEGVIDAVTSNGLRAWQPPADVAAISDGLERHSTELWAFLKSFADAGATPRPQLVVGWGTADRFGRSASQIATVVPESQVFTRPGGHKWTTWRPLFDTLAPRIFSP